MQGSSRLKSAVSILLLSVSSLLVTSLALESWLAIAKINTKSTAQYVPGKGTTYVPGAYYRNVAEGFSEGYINSAGFRDYERTREKPQNTFRILVLGNSYAEAFQVPLENSFAATLERKLNENSKALKFEVLNLGQSGFGTADEYVRYVKFGVNYSPDLVLLTFVTTSDFRGNSKAFNSEMTYFFDLDEQGNLTLDDSRFIEYDKTYTPTKRAYQFVKQHSYLASLISEWVFKLKYWARQESIEKAVVESEGARKKSEAQLPESSSLNLYLPERSENWKSAIKITEAGIRKIRDTVEANRSHFMLVTLTNAEQVHPEIQKQLRDDYPVAFDFDLPDRIIEEFAAGENIDFLKLAPEFREYHLRTGKYLHGFGSGKAGHWNENGHRLAAEKIFEFLKSKHLVPLD